MTAAEIAAALGGKRRAGGGWLCRCPAHNDRAPSLSLRDGDRALIVRCWAGCDPRDVLTMLRRLGLIARRGGDARPVPMPHRGEDREDAARRINLARRIWGAARDAQGGPVERYLLARGIDIPLPPSLRWAPSLRRPDGTYGPAMVALVEQVNRGFVGVHRTWLARDAASIWRRRDRASLGPIGGGAVRLAPAAETLMVGEGIETCLAAMEATAMPAWAALSTAGMVALALLPIVRQVIILADHDRSGTGERAARTAAARWLAEDRKVKLAMPPEPGTDLADVLAGRACPEIRDAAA
jgi:putative DNA primase/helicase